MLGREKIHNSAILKPQFTRCQSVVQTGNHDYAVMAKGGKQCINCGKIKPYKEQTNGIHRQHPSK